MYVNPIRVVNRSTYLIHLVLRNAIGGVLTADSAPTWASSNTAVATVSANASGLDATVTLAAPLVNGSTTVTATVTIATKVYHATQVFTVEAPQMAQVETMTLVVNPDNANLADEATVSQVN